MPRPLQILLPTLRSTLLSSLVLLSAAGLAGAPPAAAVTIASFSAGGAGSNLRFVNNGTGAPDQASSGSGGRLYATATATGQSPGFAAVTFRFLDGPLASLGPVAAWFQLDAATTVPAALANGQVSQGGLNGMLRFTNRSALTLGTTTHAAGTELLRADFTGAVLSGTLGGTTATLGTTAGTSVSLSSALADFSNARDLGFSLSVSSLLSPLFVAGSGTAQSPYRALRSFRAVAGGQVEASNSVAVSAVPEPETWAMLVAGLALVGLQQRRPRRRAIAG